MKRYRRRGVPAAERTVRHPLLAAIVHMEEGLIDTPGLAPFADDPDWLSLPAARREAALKRLEAITSFLARDERSVAAIDAAAARAGVSRRLFYDLVDAWEGRPEHAIWDLVPYAARRETGRAKLEADVRAELERLIRNALGNGPRPRDEVVADVLAGWPEGLRRPAINTVRRHVEAMAGGSLHERGVLRSPAGDDAGTLISADRHGEVLVIDHVGLSIYADHEHDPAPLTLTLAIDLHTATIAGFQALDRPPAPIAVRAALIDAMHTSRDNPGEPITPRIVMAGGRQGGWQEMADRLRESGVATDLRLASGLRTGMFAQRLIGSDIAGLPISPRVRTGRRGHGFDPRHHALVTPHQAEHILSSVVALMNEQRFDLGTVRNRIVLPTGLGRTTAAAGPTAAAEA